MRATRTVTNLLGQQVTVFCNDHVGDRIAKRGMYEKENIALLLTLLEQIHKPVVLDIGANIGNHSLAFATRAAQVHAFEPIPEIHALLRQNVEQNALQNVTLHAVALSDTDGQADIHMVQDGNMGASSFDKPHDNVERISVPKRRGDTLVETLHLPGVDLVKIDVEAHEAYVLRGLMQTLTRYKPFITMEWNDPLTIERLSGSAELQFLFEHYQVWVLGNNGDRGWWAGKAFPFLRRKWVRMFKPREAVLYPFNPARVYKNLLLVPKGKEGVMRLFRHR